MNQDAEIKSELQLRLTPIGQAEQVIMDAIEQIEWYLDEKENFDKRDKCIEILNQALEVFNK